MALIDRARRFVQAGNPTDQLPLLLDCIAARNSEGLLAVKMLARDKYTGDSLDLLLKAPAAYCLLAWGQAGLQALVENALEEPTSKNFSLAFQLLASTAEGHEPETKAYWTTNRQLRAAVSDAVRDWSGLATSSRSYLNELVLSIENDDDAARYAGTSLFIMSVQDHSATKNLCHALALRSIAVGPRVLATYHKLMAEKDKDEPTFQHFFEAHPLLLDSRAFQVWGKPDLHGKLEPDFVIRRYDNSYAIVEIETPAKLLITKKGQLSAQATNAIGQVLEYREFLLNHLTAAKQAFPKFGTPSGLVVVGLESSLDVRQKDVLRSENQSRSDIRIVGFDALAINAKAITSNVVHGIPGAIAGMRLP